MIAFDQSCWLVRRRAKRENGSSFSDREIERLLGGALAPAVQHMLEFSSAVYFAAHVDEDGGWEGEPPLFSPVPLPFDPARYQIQCRHGIRGQALPAGNRSIDDICPAIPDCEVCKMLATALVQEAKERQDHEGEEPAPISRSLQVWNMRAGIIGVVVTMLLALLALYKDLAGE